MDVTTTTTSTPATVTRPATDTAAADTGATDTATTGTRTTPPGATAPVDVPVRLPVDSLLPHLSQAMEALAAACRQVSLEGSLQELVRARASQLNGCAYCVDLHTRDARAGGEDERRLHLLPVWREASLFTARERAALELTEAATRLAGHPVPDEVFDRAAAQFSEVELAELIWTITEINAWNRLGATARPWRLP